MCVCTDAQAKESMDRSFLIIDPMDFNTFSKCWFEVAIRSPSKLESPADLSLDNSPSFNSPIVSLSNLGYPSPFYMGFDKEAEKHESEFAYPSQISPRNNNIMYTCPLRNR